MRGGRRTGTGRVINQCQARAEPHGSGQGEVAGNEMEKGGPQQLAI